MSSLPVTKRTLRGGKRSRIKAGTRPTVPSLQNVTEHGE